MRRPDAAGTMGTKFFLASARESQAMNQTASAPAEANAAAPANQRLVALDAYRGLIMLTLAAGGFGLLETARNLGYWPQSDGTFWGALWNQLAFHTHHPPWISHFRGLGVSYWDLIQPAFMFMVGVAVPFSYAKRRARGDSTGKLLGHALWRSLVLIALGVFLQTKNTGLEPSGRLLVNVLTQIGLGYFFLVLLYFAGTRWQLLALVAILVGYGWAMLRWPVPEPLPPEAQESIAQLPVKPQVAVHFAKGVNLPESIDQRLLGAPNPGGYATLNFVPSLGTMLLGLLAGTLVRSRYSQRRKLLLLLLGAGVCFALGLAAGYTVCPIIKRIWTPSFTLFSGGWVLLMLAGFFWLTEVLQWRRWTYPLVVVGANSLAMYMMGQLMWSWVAWQWQVYLGADVFAGTYGPLVRSLVVLGTLWMFCWYLYRHKLFFRV